MPSAKLFVWPTILFITTILFAPSLTFGLQLRPFFSRLGLQRLSNSTTGSSATPSQSIIASKVGLEGTFKMRHPGHCSGMYWRNEPKKGGSFSSPPDWPKNGALLKGTVHEVPARPENSLFWLEVKEYMQAGSSSWTKTPNCWMQFEQGGFLLHPEETK